MVKDKIKEKQIVNNCCNTSILFTPNFLGMEMFIFVINVINPVNQK